MLRLLFVSVEKGALRVQMADTNATFIIRAVGQLYEMALISPGLVVFTVQRPYHQGILYAFQLASGLSEAVNSDYI